MKLITVIARGLFVDPTIDEIHYHGMELAYQIRASASVAGAQRMCVLCGENPNEDMRVILKGPAND